MDTEDLAYTPSSGGKVKMILLGGLLPVWLMWHAISIWVAKMAILPARKGTSVPIYEEAARSVAVTLACLALFCHARWVWGLLPQFYRTHEVLTILAALGAALSMGAMMLFALAP